jgi:hypothetical protein
MKLAEPLGNLAPIIKADVQSYRGLGITASFFQFFQGRATAFGILFTVVGIILAFRGKLTGDYVALVGAIQTLVVGHSLKEDYFARRGGDKQ